MRNSSNAVAFTGSNTVLRGRALEDFGGFDRYDTEDFETASRYRRRLYDVFHHQAAGKRLAPTSIKTW
jgi:cellulose synthase (UDP-forming)